MIKEAATAIVLRDGAQGPEVLLVRRSQRSGFFPHAWVFPGGVVDALDDRTPAVGDLLGLACGQRKYALAAIRETREETGLDIAGDPPDLSRLKLWSWWLTPEAEPRRYDTLFFVARACDDAKLHADDANDPEITGRIWITAAEAIRRVVDEHEPLWMAPPTFRTLEELRPYASVADVFAAERVVHRVTPRLDKNDDGTFDIVLPGDPTYPSVTPLAGSTRIRFAQGRWWSL